MREGSREKINFMILVNLFLLLQFTPSDGGQDLSLSSFLISAQQLKAKLGDNVRFPCPTTSTGGAVITWSWNGRLISAGAMKVYTDDRIKVVDDGRELVLNSVTKEDRGEWSCTVQLKLEPLSLSHRLEILIAPSVSLLHSKDTVNIEEGSTANFECSAEGFPAPTVHWVSESRRGQVVSRGPSLTLSDVAPDISGGYRCVATNSLGESHQTLTINVLYKPRTKLSRQTTSRNSYSATTQLSCQVQANPTATVTLYKDTQIMSNSLVKSGKKDKFDIYSITIGGLTESDYGNYSCVARNSLGTSSDSLKITGQPDQPVVTSTPQGLYTNNYKLIWTVWTPPSAKILNQSILYRRIKKGVTSSSPNLNTSSWYNLALISDSASYSGSGHSYSMLLTGLDKDCQYEVRLRAMNSHGWSQLSEPFIFTTSSQNKQELLSSSLLSSESPNIFILSKNFLCLLLFVVFI